MFTNRVVIALGLASLAACATSPGTTSHTDPRDERAAPVRWVEGPTPDVSTLLLEPHPVGRVGGPAIDETELSIGAFYARYQSNLGRIEQLALLVQLEGGDPNDLIGLQPGLTLEIDGIVFTGEPGATGNTLGFDETPGGRRALMVIPITREALEKLVQAERVRGRVGMWADFVYQGPCRGRLAALLEGLPEDALLPTIQATPAAIGYRGATE